MNLGLSMFNRGVSATSALANVPMESDGPPKGNVRRPRRARIVAVLLVGAGISLAQGCAAIVGGAAGAGAGYIAGHEAAEED